eukprot:jgi/Ulvmu1/7129/UM034_0035.1
MAYPTLYEVSPAIPASGDKPSRGPSFKATKYKSEPDAPSITLFDTFENSVKNHANGPCLGYRPIDDKGKPGDYTFMTYKEVHDKVKAFASALQAAGVQKQQRVAIFGQNCCEWMIAMQACNRMGYECVPLYDTLGENAIEYIIDHSESVYLVVAGAKLPNFAAALPKMTQTLLGIAYWGKNASSEALTTIANAGIKATPYEELLASGAAAEVPADPPTPDDLCTIMYTSGTTGDPKGVMLTHASVVATVHALKQYLVANKITIGPGERMLSYLPLAHIFDRTSEEMFLSLGGTIGYWQGSLPDLVADIAALKPSQFHGVPRVYDRIYTRIKEKTATSGCVKSFLFKWAHSAKLAKLKAGFPSAKAAPFWDKLVFSKIKATLGGEVTSIVSGGAPLAPHVEEFLKVAMCAPVVQGYGLTESCAASFIAEPDTIAHAGTVGPPMPVTEFALESVTEMKYDALGTPARGELLLKGPNLFKGYYKMQDKTDEVLEAGGWFHTGDIAEIQPDGAIKIIDRKKNIFKLSQGEYVAVEKVEAEYKKCSAIDQIWVYGNSFESCLVAVAVPNRSKLLSWAGGAGVQTEDWAALCNDAGARAMILSELQAQGKASKLRGFEMLKAVHLHPEEFSIENDLITPTFKLKRPQLLEFFKGQVDGMYTSLKRA